MLLKITCGRTAGRQSTRGDKHLLALSSPSRTLGSPVFLFSSVTTTILTVMAILTSLLPCPKLRFILTLKYLIASRTVASGTKQPALQLIKVRPDKSDNKSLSSFLSIISTNKKNTSSSLSCREEGCLLCTKSDQPENNLLKK